MVTVSEPGFESLDEHLNAADGGGKPARNAEPGDGWYPSRRPASLDVVE